MPIRKASQCSRKESDATSLLCFIFSYNFFFTFCLSLMDTLSSEKGDNSYSRGEKTAKQNLIKVSYFSV